MLSQDKQGEIQLSQVEEFKNSKSGFNQLIKWCRKLIKSEVPVAVQHNKDLRTKYLRIKEGKSSKMIGITALQRRILVLIYTLWRKDEEYRENYTQPAFNKTGRDNKSLPAQDELQPNRLKSSFV